MKNYISLVLLISTFNLTNCKATKCCKKDHVLFPVSNETKYICQYLNNSQVIPILGQDNLKAANLAYDICIDKTTNDSIIKINSKGEYIENVHVKKINKCCPKQMTYNISGKMCENSNITQMPIFVNKATNFSPNYTFCQEDGALVDILTNVTQLAVNFDTVEMYNTLTDKKEVVVVGNSCFDLTREGYVVVRSCQSRDICSEIACVRKCCGIGLSYGNMKCLPYIKTSYNTEIFLSESDQDTEWNSKYHSFV